jgi:hypothetical protein
MPWLRLPTLGCTRLFHLLLTYPTESELPLRQCGINSARSGCTRLKSYQSGPRPHTSLQALRRKVFTDAELHRPGKVGLTLHWRQGGRGHV